MNGRLGIWEFLPMYKWKTYKKFLTQNEHKTFISEASSFQSFDLFLYSSYNLDFFPQSAAQIFFIFFYNFFHQITPFNFRHPILPHTLLPPLHWESYCTVCSLVCNLIRNIDMLQQRWQLSIKDHYAGSTRLALLHPHVCEGVNLFWAGKQTLFDFSKKSTLDWVGCKRCQPTN